MAILHHVFFWLKRQWQKWVLLIFHGTLIWRSYPKYFDFHGTPHSSFLVVSIFLPLGVTRFSWAFRCDLARREEIHFPCFLFPKQHCHLLLSGNSTTEQLGAHSVKFRGQWLRQFLWQRLSLYENKTSSGTCLLFKGPSCDESPELDIVTGWLMTEKVMFVML